MKLILKNELNGRVFKLKVVSGYDAVDVRMSSPPTVSDGCEFDRHCACHGGNPYFCCKCGAEFSIVR